MSESEGERVDRSKVVLVSIPGKQDEYNVIKTLARELRIPFEEASALIAGLPHELLSGVPHQAASNFADKLSEAGAEVEVLPEGPLNRYCAFHPQMRARSKCKVCDEYICEKELLVSKGKLFCEDHWKRHKFRRTLIIILVSLILAVGAIFYFTGFDRRLFSSLPTVLHKTHWRVAVICLTDQGGPDRALLFNGLSTSASPMRYYSAERHALVDLDGWFQKEYEHWSHKYNDFTEINIYGLYEVENLPPIPMQSGTWSFRNAREDKNFTEFLRQTAEKNGVPVGDYDMLMFVYFYNKTVDTKDYIENICYGGTKAGFVMWAINTNRSIDFYITAVGHCIAREMGATVHLNEHGHPSYPQGLAEPSMTTRYPQKKAEMMAPYIAIQQYKVENVHSLDQVAIGPFTAYELGWINKNELDVYAPTGGGD